MRTLVVIVCALLGALIGGVLDLVSTATAHQYGMAPQGPLLIYALGLFGLVVGLVVARLLGPRRPRRTIDPAKYPNRIIGTRGRGTPSG